MGDSPGWEAIDEALADVYGDVEPKHYGTIMKWRLGGPDPLDGVSIYESTAFDVAHWHYVSYGLTELYSKESEDPDESGWGFELTFRLRRDTDDDAAQPPIWPINLMQNLARYVFRTGATFSPGHHMDANGPIAVDVNTELTGIVFAEDPQLPARSTPHGRMDFVQIVGVTSDELAAAQAWNTAGVLALLAKRTPGWVSDLGRRSALADEGSSTIVREGIEREGSSMGLSFTDQLVIANEENRIVLTLGALGIEELRTVIPGRLRFDRTFAMISTQDREVGVILESGSEVELLPPTPPDRHPTLTLPPEVVTAFAERVQPKQGRYELSPRLTVVVKKTDIKSSDGTRVTHSVG